MGRNLNMEDDALVGLTATTTLTGEEGYRERSANLKADPKMRELKKFTKYHGDAVDACMEREAMMSPVRRAVAIISGQQSRAATPFADAEVAPSRGALQTDGCTRVNTYTKRLCKAKAELPRMGSNSELPEAFLRRQDDAKDEERSLAERERALKRYDRSHTQMGWHDSIDHSLRRLMLDMELARDDRLKKSADKARCQHLDKVYDWFGTHGHMEAKKSVPAPPYVRFSLSGPVMPGSLRVAPKTRESATSTTHGLANRGSRGDTAMGQSASLPSLTALGSSPLDSPHMAPHKAGL